MTGNIILDTNMIRVDNILLDSGATDSSYISSTFIDKHSIFFNKYKYKTNKNSINLAVKNAIGVYSEGIDLVIELNDEDNNKCSSVVKFRILDINHDIIIGLPDIISSYSTIFCSRIINASNKHNDEVYDSYLTSMDLIQPLSKPIGELESIEELETPIPRSFPVEEMFAFLSSDEYQKSVQKYYDSFDTQVSKDFAAAMPVYDLLRSKVNVFCPTEWTGINGLDAIEFQWKPDCPTTYRPKVRLINSKLWENAAKEVKRLQTYLWVPSNSPVASPLVVAPKATDPFIRNCIDLTYMNKFMELPAYPMKHVFQNLNKIRGFKYFLDLDLTNGYHQLKLGSITSDRLSVITPWGLFKPLFMPEGAKPAAQIFQSVMNDVFKGYEDFLIVIMDNILVLCDSYEDAYNKLEMVLNRCEQRNVHLKFSKSWLGFTKVNFYGYVCEHNSYTLSEERRSAIKKIPFPQNQKQAQRVMGSGVFFKPFVRNYSTLSAPLYDMTKKEFSWNKSKWKVDYITLFEEWKSVLANALSVFYPNYELEWVVRSDASDVGVGGAIFQKYINIEGIIELQPIFIWCMKLSELAQRWATIEKECFAIFAIVRAAEYLLRLKYFVVETDHNNLIWMEKSIVAKIIRWVIFLQSFNFMIKHIPGKLNVFADMLSRIYEEDKNNDDNINNKDDNVHLNDNEIEIQHNEIINYSNNLNTIYNEAIDNMLAKVHGKTFGHEGIRNTWLALNELFPGHNIPYKYVEEYVLTCPIC